MNAKTFLDQFGHLADAPNGIPKLRELILQLAVRGKLVPQDPNDEPASELLKRIQAEKQRLIVEGTIRKPKPLPDIPAEDKPWSLPSRWEWSRAGNVAYLIRGITFPASAKSTIREKDTVACLRTTNVQAEIEWHDLLYVPRDYVKRDVQFTRKGDLMISLANSYELVGKVALIYDIPEVSTFGGFIGAIRTALIPPEYLLHVFRSSYMQVKLRGSSSQTTNIANISLKGLNPIPIPIPPLAEQKRIVAKVDELMALCDELEGKQQAVRTKQIALNRASLRALTEPNGGSLPAAWHRVRDHFDHLYTVPETVADLRQTILQLAVMGRLVPQDPSDLPAPRPGKHFVYALECDDGSVYIGQTQDVLKRWEQHVTGLGADWTKRHPPVKLAHWEEYDTLEEAVKREKDLKTGFGRKWLKREIAAGRTRQAGEPASILLKKIQAEKQRLIAEGVIRKPKLQAPIDSEEMPFELPDGWAWSRLGDPTWIRGGVTKGRKLAGRKTAEYPYLRVANVQRGFLDLEEIKTIAIPVEEMEKYSLERNDLLVVEGGDWDKVGRSAIWYGEVDPCLHQNHVFRVRSLLEDLDPAWLMLFLNSAAGRAYFEQASKQTTNLASINMTQLKGCVIPIPPVSAQKRIIAKVNQLMTLCDDLEAKLQQSQADADNLLTAIVHRLTVGKAARAGDSSKRRIDGRR